MASSRRGCNDGFTLAGRMRDRRAQIRGRTARLVQVAHEGDAAYARCRDFSDIGMKLDLTAPLELNAQVSIALSPSIVLFGTVAWSSGNECGIAFDGPVDSAGLIEAADETRRGQEMPAMLDLLSGRQAQGRAATAQGEAQCPNRIRFEAGLAVTVMTGSNQEQRGTVRWAKGNIAAVEFAIAEVDEYQASQQGLLSGPGRG